MMTPGAMLMQESPAGSLDTQILVSKKKQIQPSIVLKVMNDHMLPSIFAFSLSAQSLSGYAVDKLLHDCSLTLKY